MVNNGACRHKMEKVRGWNNGACVHFFLIINKNTKVKLDLMIWPFSLC